MPLFGEDVPEDGGEGLIVERKSNFLRALDEGVLLHPRLRQSGKVALYIGNEDGHARL